MKAGRSLDALVAEHVMGLKVYTFSDETSQFDPLGTWSPGAECHMVDITYACPVQCEGDCQSDEGHILGDYSTDTAVAFEVVEKLEEFKLRRLSNCDWRVHAYGLDHYVDADSKSLPHAICLVALQSVGHGIQ